MLFAALSDTGWAIVLGSYVGICLLAWLIRPRDVNGRKRANGCIVGLVIFFGLLLAAFAAWAADNLF